MGTECRGFFLKKENLNMNFVNASEMSRFIHRQMLPRFESVPDRVQITAFERESGF